MRREQFQINEAGYVYVRARSRTRQFGRRQTLGHISELLSEESIRGRSVKRWWDRYLRHIGWHRKTENPL
jgi:hypothetical protein